MKKNKISLMVFLSGIISIVFVIFMCIAAVSYIRMYTDSITKIATVNTAQSVSLVQDTLDMTLGSVKQDFLLIEEKVMDCSDATELKRYLNSVVSVRSGISTIMIYNTRGELLNYGMSDGELKDKIGENLSFLPDVFNENGTHISAPHVQNIFKSYYPWVISVGYQVPSKLYGEDIFLVMDVSVNSILSYFDSVTIGDRGYCFIVDKQGNYVYHPQQQLIFSGIKEEDIDTIMGLENETAIQDGRMYSVAELPEFGWKIVGVSYTDEVIDERVNDVYYTMTWIVAVCLVMLIICIWLITNSVSKPVEDLVKAMKQFEGHVEEFKYQQVRGIAEVESLSNSFAHMVVMIQKLLIRAKEEEKCLRKTELKALQTQINPHFLYNTLDSIQWMCEQQNTEKAVEMVSALAKLFRISISKGKEFITIEQELTHVRNYMIIQSFRFKNQFTYEFKVDDEVLNYYCNKITLQPIVENAIIHGIDGLCDEGEIVISAKLEGNEIVLSVEDNGVGMSQEKCDKILEHDASDNFGIGIKNVNDRLKIYFGERYGLKVESELDMGTKITIRFPKLTATDLKKEGLE